MATEYRSVQLIWDADHGDENQGWYTRHDEYVDGALLNGMCDNGLQCVDHEAIDTALDEAVIAYFCGRVDRSDIEVIA